MTMHCNPFRPIPSPEGPCSRHRLLALVDAFAQRRVVVVGDLVADEFI